MPRSILCVVLTTACGDSLRSGEALDELFGLTPVPENVAWEMRWFVGEDGLLLSCELHDAEVVFEDDAIFGEIVVSPPRPEPPYLFDADGVNWALGFPVLVDVDRYDDALPRRAPRSLDESRGVWGIPPGIALLVAEGDAQALEDQLLVDGAWALEEGAVWVEVVATAVAISGRLDGALVVVDDFTDLLVFQREHIDEAVMDVWSGLSLGGLHPADNCE